MDLKLATTTVDFEGYMNLPKCRLDEKEIHFAFSIK